MKKTVFLITLILLSFSFAEDHQNKVKIDHIFKLTAKADRDLYDNGSSNNFDNFYGRVGYGIHVSVGNFEGTASILAYPSGFGYELLRGIETPADTMGLENQKIAKFQVDEAFVTHHGRMFDINIGRFVLFNSNGDFYGNYVDEGPGGYFTGKGVSANVVEFKSSYKMGTTSILVGTQDPNVNEGYFRLFQDIKLTDAAHIGLGFRSNFLDKVHASDAEVLSNATAIFDYTFNEKVALFVEAGFTNLSKDTDAEIPLVFGVKMPAKPVFDKVALEMEYLKEDQRPTIGDKQQSPVLIGLHLERDLNKHFTLKAGLFTQREVGEMGVGLRMDAKL